ncbi:MAG TPA: divalent metal cation transporter [Methylomirabilota bacterium]|nr:divalent metal cation transporter [Methylomirabilota bacterium]
MPRDGAREDYEGLPGFPLQMREPEGHTHNPLVRYFKTLGPGLVTGASDDDPSGITTYSVVGASMGYGMLWTAPATLPLTIAVQLICARIGLVTGFGLAGAVRRHYPRPLLYGACLLLLVANVFNIAADLAGMAEAASMLTGLHTWMLVPVFGVAILLVTVYTSYATFARSLKWLTAVLFAYIVTAVLVTPDWGTVLRATLLPTLRWDSTYVAALVGILGTTISPYLFFWQASQEVEEEKGRGRRTLAQRRGATPHELRDARLDVTTGICFSNLVFYFIILTTAATLYQAGHRDIQTARQAAEALRPLAGDGAYLLFALGLIGTGLLAIPVLAGSASFAVAELFGWRSGLDLSPRRGRRFYLLFAGAMAAGMALDFFGFNPTRMLFYSAVVNGLLAPPLMVLVMLVGNNPKIMGKHTNTFWLNLFGWGATAAMGIAAVALALTAV